MILEEKCLLIMIMILISSISAQKCKKPKVQRFVFCGPVVRISSGQCGGLHPGQAVPVPRAGLHLGQQEGRGLGPVPCSVSCTSALGSGVCSSVALGAAAACIMERCMKSGQALNTTLMAVSRLFGTWIARRCSLHHVCQVNLSCEMSEESGVASVVYQVDTADCGSAELDHIREKVDSNSHKLDQLLACTSCNSSNSTTFTTGPLGNNNMQYTLCRLRYI